MAKSAAPKAIEPIVEEHLFRSENAFLSVMLNKRTRFIRVIDFRAGALPAKRIFIQSVANKEGATKVVTLVEKDEVSAWTRMGFVREGTIPGFYKRSDGHLVGCVMSEGGEPIELSDDAAKIAEKTINTAKKHTREVERNPKGVVISQVTAEIANQARDLVWSKKLGLGSFDAFGRGAERVYFQVQMGNRANFLSAEFQDCFGHSLIEILRTPTQEDELWAMTAGLLQLCEAFLKERGIVSAFAFAPVDDVGLATMYLSAGFRKTGLLASACLVGDVRKDAILWTRKLANPEDENDVE